MTNQTPIERAAQAMADDWNPDRDPILTAMFHDYAASAMDSIDVEQLAKVIEAYKSRGVGSAGIAQTIKNWLTGKEPQ